MTDIFENPISRELSGYGHDDLVLLYDGGTAIGIPYDAPPELILNIIAAVKAHALGNKSIDYTKRQYEYAWKHLAQLDSESKLAREITAVAKERTRVALEKVIEIKEKPDRFGLFVASAAFLRLQSTIRIASFAIHNGFHYEASSLMRIILEQLAWIYTVYNIQDDKLLRIEPTKCITNLRTLFPGVGKFYGELSEGAHVSPDILHRYIRLVDGKLSIFIRTSKYEETDALRLLYLADMYSVSTEVVYADWLTSFAHTKTSKDKVRIPKTTRPIRKLLNKYRRSVLKKIV